jgi:hypothetical protein
MVDFVAISILLSMYMNFDSHTCAEFIKMFVSLTGNLSEFSDELFFMQP